LGSVPLTLAISAKNRGGREEVVLDEMDPGAEATALGLAAAGAVDQAFDPLIAQGLQEAQGVRGVSTGR